MLILSLSPFRAASYRSISSTVAQPQAVSTLTYPLQLVFRRPNRSITLAIASRYLLASSVTTATYVIGNRLRQGDESGDLGFFQPTHRYPYHLNEKLLFVIGANVVFGCGLAVWDVASGKWNKPSGSRSKVSLTQKLFFFAHSQENHLIRATFYAPQEQPQVQIITKLRPVLLRGMAFSAVHAFACFAIYYVFRRTAWSLLLNNTGGLLRCVREIPVRKRGQKFADVYRALDPLSAASLAHTPKSAFASCSAVPPCISSRSSPSKRRVWYLTCLPLDRWIFLRYRKRG